MMSFRVIVRVFCCFWTVVGMFYSFFLQSALPQPHDNYRGDGGTSKGTIVFSGEVPLTR
jgi:hypothetical protein